MNDRLSFGMMTNLRMSRAAVAFFALPALCVIPASTAFAQRDTSFTVGASGVVDITVRSGRIVVRGTDRSTGAVRGRSGDYQLRSTGVGITVTGRDTYDDGRDGRNERRMRSDGEAALEVDVPRNVRVVISTTSADVELSDVGGNVEIRTYSGDVLLRRLTGRLNVETISGDVVLEAGTSSVSGARVTTVSGDVRLNGVRNEVQVNSTSGDVSLQVERVTRVEARTVSGDVSIDGSLTSDVQLQTSTHTGDVILTLDDEVKGTLEFSTYNGDLEAGGPLVMMPGSSGSRQDKSAQRYQLGGGGGARLVITTFNGDVRISRRR